MPERSLAGSRIRQTRLTKGIAQGVLAQSVGISPSYLSLIEHNKRRIGGKLVVALAAELGVDAAALSEGSQSDLLAAMDQAAAAHPDIQVEAYAAQEMAGRFAGWAALISAQQGRIDGLAGTIETLVDRLTHDPQLATSIHEMLSVVTAIRSTAGILANAPTLEPEWQSRFHRNLLEDAKRLAGNAQALVVQLDASDDDSQVGPALPKDELENWLAARAYYVAELEGASAISVDTLLATEDQLTSSTALKRYAQTYLHRYRRDAVAVPMDGLLAAWEAGKFEPLQYSQEIGSDLPRVLRRLACMPSDSAGSNGLAICDNSGTLTFSKQVAGFALPRFGAACPLWPLYQALSCPGIPFRTVVEQSGHQPLNFVTYAIAQPITVPDFAKTPLYEATMLILPRVGRDGPDSEVQPIGSSCRICPRQECRGRREPSILTTGF